MARIVNGAYILLKQHRGGEPKRPRDDRLKRQVVGGCLVGIGGAFTAWQPPSHQTWLELGATTTCLTYVAVCLDALEVLCRAS